VKYEAAFIGVPISMSGAVGKSVQAALQDRDSVLQVVGTPPASLTALS
jgi:hypothetical protein